jgi:LemA protein
VSQAWSNIDVLLKQRHDELPKLIETCKQYMGFEKDVLQKVTQARAAVAHAREAGNVRALGPAEMQLRATMGNLYAVAENYPELRANESFQNLQSRISQLEAQIADRREFYNDSVNTNNIRIEQVPDAFIARMLHFGARELLTFDKSELQDVNVKALFNS